MTAPIETFHILDMDDSGAVRTLARRVFFPTIPGLFWVWFRKDPDPRFAAAPVMSTSPITGWQYVVDGTKDETIVHSMPVIPEPYAFGLTKDLDFCGTFVTEGRLKNQIVTAAGRYFNNLDAWENWVRWRLKRGAKL